MLNLGEADFTVRVANSEVTQKLRDGDIVAIDITRPHSSRQLSVERFCLTFRRIHAQYLPQQK